MPCPPPMRAVRVILPAPAPGRILPGSSALGTPGEGVGSRGRQPLPRSPHRAISAPLLQECPMPSPLRSPGSSSPGPSPELGGAFPSPSPPREEGKGLPWTLSSESSQSGAAPPLPLGCEPPAGVPSPCPPLCPFPRGVSGVSPARVPRRARSPRSVLTSRRSGARWWRRSGRGAERAAALSSFPFNRGHRPVCVCGTGRAQPPPAALL